MYAHRHTLTVGEMGELKRKEEGGKAKDISAESSL